MKFQIRKPFLGAVLAVAFTCALTAHATMSSSPQSGEQVRIFADNYIGEDEVVGGQAVAVMGNLTIDGIVQGQAVAVMGDLTINGTVHGQAVAVMGDLILGPDARVDGQVVCVGGHVRRAPGAYVGGAIVTKGPSLHMRVIPHVREIVFSGINSKWVWTVNLVILALYAMVALVFPEGVRRCGDMLVKRPGFSILSAVLTLLVLPVLFVLFLITIVGIPIAIVVLPVSIVGLMMFGKASFYALVGHAISRGRLHPAVAVLLGGLLCLPFLLIPVAGVLLSVVLSVLMLGCAVAALFTSGKHPPPEPASAAAPMVAPVEQPVADSPPAAPPVLVVAPIPPPLDAAALPRAGFWIRLLALIIDAVIVVGVFHAFGPLCLFLLGAYGAIMWKIKGTTVGGIVCSLAVVRLDGRPLDWNTAIARAAGCYLSMIALCVGFIWVAFDGKRQSWHDKIAGTVVVRAPQGRALF